MPKCTLCEKSVKKLVSYGKMLICKDCLKEQELQATDSLDAGKWLIRTTEGQIVGPYDHEKVRTLITDKKVVFLDEVSRNGEDWNLIKNIPSFKDLALKTDYKLDESTVDVDINDLGTTQETRSDKRPPRFRKEVKLPISLPELEVIKSAWKRPVFAVVAVLVVVVAGLSIYIGTKHSSSRTIAAQKAGNGENDYFNKYYIKGREYEEGGLFKEALENYKKALTAVPDNSGVRIRKAAIDLMVYSNEVEASKALQELYSESNIGKITDQEELCDIKTFLGLLELEKNNIQSAIAYFNQALAIRPTNAYLYYNIGRAMYKQQNYIGAMEYFKNAKKLSASFSDAALYEGISLLKLNKYREAANVFNDAVTQNPNMREFYTFGAYAFMKSSNLSKAAALIKKVLEIDPYYFKREFTPLYQLAKEDFLTEEVTNTYELVKVLDGGQKEETLCVFALLYLIKGYAEEAVKVLATSTNKTDTSEKLMTRGIIYFHQQKMDEAKTNIDKSLELDYSNNIAHLYAGQIALSRNDLGQARNHFTKAQSADENTSLYATTLLGDIYIKSGEQNAAIILWKKVLSLDARYIPAWERILSFNN